MSLLDEIRNKQTSSSGTLLDQLRKPKPLSAEQRKIADSPLMQSRSDLLGAVEKFKPAQKSSAPVQTELRGPIDSVPLTKEQEKEANKIYSTLGPRSPLERGVGMLSEGVLEATNSATLGIPGAIERKMLGDNGFYGRPEDERTWAGKAGEIAGEFMPLSKAYAVTKPLISAFKGTATRNLAHDVMAGLAFQGAKELADSGLDTRNDGSQSLGQRALNVGESAALFAAGGALFRGVGRELKTHNPDLVEPQLKDSVSKLTSVRALNKAGALATDKTVKSLLPEQLGTQPSKPVAESTVKLGEPTMLDGRLPVSTEVKGIEQAPFERVFGEQNVGITPFGSKSSSRMVTTEQQIVDSPLSDNVKGALQSTGRVMKNSYQNMFDYLSPLKTINRETYDTAMDASRARNIANTIIRDMFVDNQGNVVGSSLNDIMKAVRGMGKRFDDYLILRHSVTRMSRGERVYDEALNMSPQKAAEMVATLEKRYPGLKQVGDAWDDFNGKLLDSAVREGLISEEAMNTMRSENPHYASMRRQFSLGEKMAQPKFGGGGSFSGQRAPIHKVSPTGSTRKIVSPIRSALEQVYAWKEAEFRNRVGQEIIKAIQENPNEMTGIARVVKKPNTSYKNLDEALREGGSEAFLEELNNDFKALFKPHNPGDENVIRVMVKGQPVYVQVDNPEAVKALMGIGSENAGIILKSFQMLSNAVKRGATGALAPMFAVKSLSADTIQAAIQAKNPFTHVLVDVPHAFLSSISDILKIPGLRNLARDFHRTGGGYSALLRGERSKRLAVWDLRKEAPLSAKGLAKGTWKTIKAPFQLGEGIADTFENLNRMAAYRRSLLNKERTPQNIRKAISDSRESVVNFSRKGAMAKEAEAFVPYTNAALQGLYRVARSFKNPKTAMKTLSAVGALVILPKMYEYAKFHDDPDYQALPARERYRNLIYGKNEDGTFNKLFMPPEYMALGAFLTDVLDDVLQNEPQAYKGAMDALANNLTPPLVSGILQGATQGGGMEQSIKGGINSTVFAPAVAIAGNQSFTGAPIVPKRLEDNSPEFQYDERTSSVAKSIGSKIGMAPLKVDYLLRSYGGDPSRLLLPLTSDAGAGTPRNTLLRNFIVDPVFTNTLSDDYYTAKEALTRARSDNKDFGKPLPEWYSDGLYRLANSQTDGSVTKILSGLTQQKRMINADQSISATEKAQQLRDVQARINEVYLEAITQFKKSHVPLPNR